MMAPDPLALEPMVLELMALRFMQASLGCVLAAASAWAVLSLAGRRWPALALSRSTWLLAQALTVATFLFAMAPHATRLSVMAPIELAPVAQKVAALAAPAPAPAPALNPPMSAAADAAPEAGAPSTRWLVRAAQAWLAVYLAGLAVAAGRLVLAQRALRRLVGGADALPDPAAHPGFAGTQAAAITIRVVETGLAVSPMLVGVWRPVLLLPRHLRDFDLDQQQLIVAHELTHLRRRDPWLMAASIAAQIALWFNPALRKLGERLTWAQEAGCDRQVLAGRPAPQRKAYAAALVGQFKLQLGAGVQGGALAFGAAGVVDASSLTARMLLIRQGSARSLGGLGRCGVIAAVGAVFAASLVLQPAFAWRMPQLQPAMLAAPAAIAWRLPLEHPRVSSFFGGVSPSRPNGHHGIDFAARTGTPVMAVADGEVVSSLDLDDGGAKYGKTIQVVHANGLVSVYAHLDRRQAARGDRVKAGQVIGLSGATGKVTGPHLHVEIRQGGQSIDPATVLSGLDALASRSALRSRAQLTAY